MNELVEKEFFKHCITCLPVEKGGECECFKQNTIALLSRNAKGKLNFPSSAWLGTNHIRSEIISSGLWNIKFVGNEYCPEFLKLMEEKVKSFKGTNISAWFS